MNERAVVCALVTDASQRVLLVRNPRWEDKFALPCRQIDPDAEPMGPAALQAVRDDLGMALPNARATPLGYLGTAGLSGRTGEPTLYQYWAFHVDAGEPIAPPAGRARFDTAADVVAAADVTWSAKDVVGAIFEGQEAVAAVITRPGRTQTEYLLLWNENYKGYFFPAGRKTAEFPPASVARKIVRGELGYTGKVAAVERAEVPEFHFSPRWGHARAYRFHLVAVELPPNADGDVIDLHRPFGPFESRLQAAEALRVPPVPGVAGGWSWRWFTSAELLSPPPGIALTETAKHLAPSVLAAAPPRVQKLRHSEGAVALIRGTDRYGRAGWLAQWNEGWGAFALIGGHREDGETFAQCVDREVREELGLAAGGPAGFTVGAALPLTYVAWSRSAACYTDYELHTFDVTLDPARQKAVVDAEKELHLRFLTPEEVSNEQTTDGRKVSETVWVLLRLAGRL